MPRTLELTGRRFGRLTALECVGTHRFPTAGSYRLWRCKCDCGNEVTVITTSLTTGNTKSCGCLATDTARAVGKASATHGASDSAEFNAWVNILQRCNNPKRPDYHNYGGRGITVCAEWSTFEPFLAHMGPRPSPKHTVERLNNDGPYAPWNCEWATRKTQGQNRRGNRLIEFGGVLATVAEWSVLVGIGYEKIRQRLDRGWTIKRTLTEGALR